MASWLKVAEDLFEVVDRRAKLVVNELADEQPDSQVPAPASSSNGRDVQSGKTRSRGRGKKKQSFTEQSPKLTAVEQEQSNVEISEPKLLTDRTEVASSEKPPEASVSQLVDSNLDSSTDTNKEETEPRISSSEVPVEVDVKYATNAATDSPASDNSVDPVIGDESVMEKSKYELDESSSLTPMDQTTISGGDPDNAISEDNPAAADAFSRAGDEDRAVPEKMEVNRKGSAEEKAEDIAPRPSPNAKKLEQNNGSPLKVQDQLDEAQGLLKTAVSTGQSKEARLARVCAGLSSRLQEYKSENAQLEELLVAERELSISYQTRINKLQKDLSLSKSELARVESSMSDALATKNSEIEALASSMNALRKQSSIAEEKLSTLQENMDTMMRSRELTETRMMQALREELSVAERRAEEERAAHNATKMAAVDREVELEHRAVEASNALARMQRTTDESASRSMELEHKLALLEVECSSLNQELQEMEARARRGQKKSSEESNQTLQVQVWQEEAERARQSQRDAENKLYFLEAEIQKMRVEMAGMRRDAEHYSRQEHVELEKRYRELTDLLYHKQTQLETMASDKAALEFQLEKEVRRLQEAQAETERSRVSRRASSAWEEDADLKTLEPLPLHHRQLAGAREQFQRAVKFLDSGAVRATRFLWRYPYARVVLLFYLVFVHLFLMYLLHRLQEQADNFSANEVAMSMGLGNSSLH